MQQKKISCPSISVFHGLIKNKERCDVSVFTDIIENLKYCGNENEDFKFAIKNIIGTKITNLYGCQNITKCKTSDGDHVFGLKVEENKICYIPNITGKNAVKETNEYIEKTLSRIIK